MPPRTAAATAARWPNTIDVDQFRRYITDGMTSAAIGTAFGVSVRDVEMCIHMYGWFFITYLIFGEHHYYLIGEHSAGLTSLVSNICTIGAIAPTVFLHSSAVRAPSRTRMWS